jgi:hypothetical protein
MAWTDIPAFTGGQVLTSAVMNQMRANERIGHIVCTSGTRPSAPDEGTMVYETDTKKVFVWNGAAWRQVATQDTPVAGSVVQMVSGFTQTMVAISTSARTDTGINATITPRFSNSTILVQAQISTRRPTSGNAGIGFDIRRNGAVVFNQTDNYYVYNSADVSGGTGVPLFFVDTPASTSALTYRIFFASYSGTVIRVQDDSHYRSYIVLWEIAA